jgi:hypothetical protein
MATAVKALLTDMMRDVLQEKCIDDVPEGDDSRAGMVKVGRHQDSATKQGIVIEVHGQHLLGPDREERHDSQGEMSRDGYEWFIPPETNGGSDLRWIRGTIRVWYHFKRKTRDEADNITEVVAARIIETIDRDSRLIGTSDAFGQRVHEVEVTDNYTHTNEGNAPAVGHMFIDWRALVSKPNSKY